MPSPTDLGTALAVLAETGTPRAAHLPTITAEKLLWVLDTCYFGVVDDCHRDILETIAQAETDGKSAMKALGVWADKKIDESIARGRTI